MVAQIDVGVEPEGMAISHDGRWAVTTSETTNMVHWIDTASHESSPTRWSASARATRASRADDRLLWVTSEIGGTVAVIDVASQDRSCTRSASPSPACPAELMQPVGLRLSRDGKTAFVALGPANRVAVVDTATFEVEKYLLVGRRVWHLDLTPDGELAVHHQRAHQRRVGDRRREPRGLSSPRRSAACLGASRSGPEPVGYDQSPPSAGPLHKLLKTSPEP